MSTFSDELTYLKHMVNETLSAGSNYLFAKYDSEIVNDAGGGGGGKFDDSFSEMTTNNYTSPSVAYNRILAEMAGLSAAQTVEQIDSRRKEISSELIEKTKISSISDFEVLFIYLLLLFIYYYLLLLLFMYYIIIHYHYYSI